jgi:hypothetical protein
VTQHRRTPPAGGHSEAFRWTGVSSFPAAVQAAGSYRHLTLDQTSDGCETGRGWSIRFGRRQGFEMSRRAFNPTAEQRGCVETLIGYGFSEAEICLLIKNPETDKFWERTRRRHVVESFGATTGKRIMLGRHVYRVHPSDQGWTLTKEGEDHPRADFPGRDDAIAEAVRLAEADEPAKIIFDNGAGTITDEWLFGADFVDELNM